MRITRWPRKMSIAVVAGAAALMTAAVATHGAANGKPMATQNERVFKAEDQIFTGTVVTNDLTAKTISVEGHNPLRRETVERRLPARDKAGRARQSEKRPPVKDSMVVFQVDNLCCVTLTNKPSADISDIQPGDEVDVDYRKTGDGTLIAGDIRTAQKHPYDQLSTKARTKK